MKKQIGYIQGPTGAEVAFFLLLVAIGGGWLVFVAVPWIWRWFKPILIGWLQ